MNKERKSRRDATPLALLALGLPLSVAAAAQTADAQQGEPTRLAVAQARGGALVGLGGQASRATRQPAPAVDGGFMHAEDARHGGRRFASLHQCDGTTTAPFQFSSASDWSCHT